MLKGGQWIDSLFKNWISPPRISTDLSGTNVKINGFIRSAIQPYLCAQCDGLFQRSIDEALANWAALNNKQTINQHDYDLEIIHGKQKATPTERYWALLRRFDQADVIKLKRLPYNDFLKTIYWDIVRNYVVV